MVGNLYHACTFIVLRLAHVVQTNVVILRCCFTRTAINARGAIVRSVAQSTSKLLFAGVLVTVSRNAFCTRQSCLRVAALDQPLDRQLMLVFLT